MLLFAALGGGCGGDAAALHTAPRLPLHVIADIALPGHSARFDYASIDPARRRLFVADLGSGRLLVIDTARRKLLARPLGVAHAHGALVVPSLKRVFVTATADNELVKLDELTYRVLARTPTGAFPDGIAYDPRTRRVFVSNKSDGTETVIDAVSGAAVGTVTLGRTVGNVAYDPRAREILVNVEDRNELAIIDPRTLRVTHRLALGGNCIGNHGLLLDSRTRLALVACEDNARLLVVDLTSKRVIAHLVTGRAPDVLSFDPTLGSAYVAAESGVVTVVAIRGHLVRPLGRAFLAPGAHTVAVDPETHEVFFPLPDVDGHGLVRVMRPT